MLSALHMYRSKTYGIYRASENGAIMTLEPADVTDFDDGHSMGSSTEGEAPISFVLAEYIKGDHTPTSQETLPYSPSDLLPTQLDADLAPPQMDAPNLKQLWDETASPGDDPTQVVADMDFAHVEGAGSSAISPTLPFVAEHHVDCKCASCIPMLPFYPRLGASNLKELWHGTVTDVDDPIDPTTRADYASQSEPMDIEEASTHPLSPEWGAYSQDLDTESEEPLPYTHVQSLAF
jgi:hypothetical protein